MRRGGRANGGGAAALLDGSFALGKIQGGAHIATSLCPGDKKAAASRREHVRRSGCVQGLTPEGSRAIYLRIGGQRRPARAGPSPLCVNT